MLKLIQKKNKHTKNPKSKTNKYTQQNNNTLSYKIIQKKKIFIYINE